MICAVKSLQVDSEGREQQAVLSAAGFSFGFHDITLYLKEGEEAKEVGLSSATLNTQLYIKKSNHVILLSLPHFFFY